MTVRLPWVAFYVDRFIKETSLLNPIEVAVYYRLFESYAQNGHLPDDEYILQEIVRLDSALSVFRGLTGGAKPDRALWDQIKESIVRKILSLFFTLDGDGQYHHAGWDEELQKSHKKYSASVKRAALMNEKRRADADADVTADAADTGETSDAVQPEVIH